MSRKYPEQISFPFAEEKKPAGKTAAENAVSPPVDRSRDEKEIADEGPECQYCQGGGPCIYCDRGRREIARLKLQRASRRS